MPSVTEILLDQARQQANAQRERGALIGNTVAGLAQIPGQVMAQRQADQDRQIQRQGQQQQYDLNAQRLEAGQQELAGNKAGAERQSKLAQIWADPSIYEPTGAVNRQAIQQRVLATVPDAWPQVEKTITELEQARQGLKKTYMEILGRTADAIRGAGNDPNTFHLAVSSLARDGVIPQDEAEKYLDVSDPQQIASALAMWSPAPKVEPFTLSQGQTRFGWDGKPLASAPAEPKMREVVVRGPNGRPVKKLVPESELIAGVEEFREPRADAMPSFQAKEVLNDAGRPVMANFDARTGRYIDPESGQAIKSPKPVPSAAETQDARKFKQAAPILGAVSELSERINTQQGAMAKLRGGVEKAKAQANYNDDVAEYEAIVSGFTPLVARALGHTGVLTQQDVDSVKALFPKPGDSKTLRDRKVARIKSLVGELESGAVPPQQAAPTIAGGDDADFDFVPGKGLVPRKK